MKKVFLLTMIIWMFIYGWNITIASSDYCLSWDIPYGWWADNINSIIVKEWDTKKIQLAVSTADEKLNKAWILTTNYIKENLLDNIHNIICNRELTNKEQLVLVTKIQKYMGNRLMYNNSLTNYYLFKNWVADEKYRLNLIKIDWDLAKGRMSQPGIPVTELPTTLADWKSQLKIAELDSAKYFKLIKDTVKSDKDIQKMFNKTSEYCNTWNIWLDTLDNYDKMYANLKEEWDTKKILSQVTKVSKNLDDKWVYSLDYIKNNKLNSINKYICERNLTVEQQTVLIKKVKDYLNNRVGYNGNLTIYYVLKNGLSDKKYLDKILKMEAKDSSSVSSLTTEEIKKRFQITSDDVNSNYANIIKAIKSDKYIRWMFGLK